MKKEKDPSPIGEPDLDLMKKLQKMAKLYSHRKAEVGDLVQDLLLEAVRTDRNFSDPGFLPWARGVLRNRAAFVARTEGRRRKREAIFKEQGNEEGFSYAIFPEAFFADLRPSLRIIARLVNCGLNRKEILYLLNIPDTAFRQRLTVLRREWKTYIDSGGIGQERITEQTTTFQRGLIRRSLQKSLRDPKGNTNKDPGGRIIGSCDPDGHLFTIRSVSAHKMGGSGNNNDEK